jgi:heptosyltransferase-3
VFSAEDGGRADPDRPPLKTLLIRPGAIGDCIVSLPALEHLRSEYTEVWVRSVNQPLIRFADRVDSIAATGLDLVGIRTPERTMERLAQFDRIISWYGTHHEEFRAAVRGLPFTFHAPLPRDGARHAVDFYAEQVGAPLGLTPRIPVGAVARRETIVMHPFSGSARKNWPLARFRELAAALPWPVEWTAGPEEPLEGALRFEDLGQLAQWLAGARGYIGNDSGISHLAAAVGLPVVALFRETNSAVWSPRPSHVRLVNDETAISALFPLFGWGCPGPKED